MTTLESKQFDDNNEVATAILAWKKYIAEVDLRELMGTAEEPEASEAGTVYEVQTPPELPGDFAIVDMRNIKVDAPELHHYETEIHIPLEGTARMSVGGDVVDLQTGNAQIIEPGIPHFVIPDDRYIVGVLSIPSFNPENQVPIDPADPPDQFNEELYQSLLGDAQ